MVVVPVFLSVHNSQSKFNTFNNLARETFMNQLKPEEKFNIVGLVVNARPE